jgi:hypothetical protein
MVVVSVMTLIAIVRILSLISEVYHVVVVSIKMLASALSQIFKLKTFFHFLRKLEPGLLRNAELVEELCKLN